MILAINLQLIKPPCLTKPNSKNSLRPPLGMLEIFITTSSL